MSNAIPKTEHASHCVLHRQGRECTCDLVPPVDSLSLYEITDYELELLEQGSPSSTYFNFAIGFFSIAASFFATLITVEIPSLYVFLTFLVLTVVGAGTSAVLFVLWAKTRSRTKNLCKKIRARELFTESEGNGETHCVPTVPIGDPKDVAPPLSGPGEPR